MPTGWAGIWLTYCVIYSVVYHIFLFGLLSLVTVVAYRLYLHPLAGTPGPQLAAITSCWHAYQVRNGRMLHLGKTLHKQYGPVVRIGPNELWFASKDAYKIIYSEFRPCVPPPPSLVLTFLQVPQTVMKSLVFIVRASAGLAHRARAPRS